MKNQNQSDDDKMKNLICERIPLEGTNNGLAELSGEASEVDLLGEIERQPSKAQKLSDQIFPVNEATTQTVKAAASELNCSISFVYKLLSIGELVYEKRGRRKLPTTASIAEYRRRNTVYASQRSESPIKGARSVPYEFKQLFQKKKKRKKPVV